MKLFTYASIVAATLLFTGCDGVGGVDQVVLPGTHVLLDATDSDNVELLEWEQVSGPKVKLSAYNISNPTFDAPIAEGITHLVFEVAVKYKDDENSSYLDSLIDAQYWFPDTIEVVVKENDKILKTGQVDSSINGDDGFYQKGIERNYVRDDIKRVVKDNVHNLLWQDNALVKKQYRIDREEDPSIIDDLLADESASEYCESLELAGRDTWRLPREIELRNLVNYANQGQTIDSAFKYTAADDYIALQTEETNFLSYMFSTKTRFPRSINFATGIESHLETTSEFNVRCVSGEKMFKHNFVRDDNLSLVHDTSNKLTWLDNERLSGTLTEAIEYCEALEYAEFSDWRMANISELTTTLDYDLSVYDLTNTSFNVGNFDYMMSSTAYVNNDSKVWAIDFGNNESTVEVVNSGSKNNYRCVRDSE